MVYFFHMFNPLTWIKANKLATVLLVTVAYLVLAQSRSYMNVRNTAQYDTATFMQSDSVGVASKMAGGTVASSRNMSPTFQEAAPAPDVANRMVVTNSQLSLVVKNVNAGITAVKTYVQSIGGYMVNSTINRPEEGGTGTITVRIPSDKLDEALEQLKGQAVKVVSENMDGQDVTDQYVDNDARMAILVANKARFEEIMKSATAIEDILEVQNQIFNLQSQIDSIKGQQKYLEQTAKMSLVTLYLSTDELSLPYAPSNAWRPAVIFKTAVRSLVSTVQGFGSFLIWLGVYAIVWLPIVLIVLFLARRNRKATTPTT